MQKPGVGEERAERDDLVGGIAGLFRQFAGGRLSGGSSGSRVPAGTSSSICPDRMTPLAHEHDPTVRQERHERNRARMLHDLPARFPPRREAHSIDTQRQQATVMDGFATHAAYPARRHPRRSCIISFPCEDGLEAATGFEPVIRVLQTHALPLGYAAIVPYARVSPRTKTTVTVPDLRYFGNMLRRHHSAGQVRRATLRHGNARAVGRRDTRNKGNKEQHQKDRK